MRKTEELILPNAVQCIGISLLFGEPVLKKYLPDYLFLFLIAGTILLIDQLSKAWIRDTLAVGQIYRPDLWITAYARIIHWRNTGAAFGMFQSAGTIFMILSSLVSLGIVYYFPQVPRREWIMRVSMAMLLGGATGNLVDRIHQGHVTDFISVGNFPVFNVADASISMGVAILFVSMWFQERGRLRSEQAEEAAPRPDDSPAEPLEARLSEEPPHE